jgi:hypothetical protein
LRRELDVQVAGGEIDVHEVSLADDNDAQGKTATQTFTWEAR